MEATDEAVVTRVQSGDLDAFGIIVERYEKRLLRYGRKFMSTHEDVQDIVQNVFMKAYVHIQSFDASRKFSSWLYRIAHNEFVNEIKSTRYRGTVYLETDSFLPHPASGETADALAHTVEIRAELESSLHRIDAKYREVLVLYYFEELSYKEIADVLHIPISTVGVRIQRGKDQLKQIYIKSYGIVTQ